MSVKPLTAKELRKLSHATADLYKATDQHAFGNQVNTLIKDVCAVEHATYCRIDLNTWFGARVFSHPDIERLAEKTTPTFVHYSKAYPEIASLSLNLKNQGNVLRVSDVVPHSLLRPIGYIEEYAKPSFSEYQLAYYFRTTGHFAGVTCNRNGREFSDKELAILKFLAPHLQSAYENTLAFEARAERAARAAVMQQVIPQEMIWLDHDFAVMEISPRIPQLIKEFFDHEMRFKQLPRKLMDWLLAARASGPLRPLILRQAGTSLKIRFYPEQLPGLNLLTFQRQRTTPTLEDLKPLGLSRREGEVLLWLAQGKTNAEISRILYINRRTADWHVQSILGKLGVENRTSATLLVADLLQG